jgi:hypothetical protein
MTSSESLTVDIAPVVSGSVLATEQNDVTRRLFAAVRCRDVDEVSRIFDSPDGANVDHDSRNDQGHTFVRIAVEDGSADIVRILLQVSGELPGLRRVSRFDLATSSRATSPATVCAACRPRRDPAEDAAASALLSFWNDDDDEKHLTVQDNFANSFVLICAHETASVTNVPKACSDSGSRCRAQLKYSVQQPSRVRA